MKKIQVKEKHLSSNAAYVVLASSQEKGREINDACAVTVASWYQSSGTVGSALAAFASGAEVEIEELQEDLSRTIQQQYKMASHIEKLAMDMLGTYLAAKSKEPENVMGRDAIVSQINRYFQAVYGEDYVYRAPETFDGFEQWMLAVASGNEERSDELMTNIEKHLKGE